VERKTGVLEYLRTQALARIFLDNFENIQSSWVTQGPDIGQVALKYGANDFGSVMMEENVVSSAGTTFRLDAGNIENLIRRAGYEPRQRNNWYELLN
jgi:cyclic dehypoxanthinyl futalosine synthase